LASLMAWRSEPAPASFRLLTLRLAGTQRVSSLSTPRRARLW
jgi:hypothetical protein